MRCGFPACRQAGMPLASFNFQYQASLMKYFVYVLKSCVDKSFYIGLSTDPERRLKEHNAGKTRSLKCKRPLKLVKTEECMSLQEARAKEKYYKSGWGRELLKKRGL